MKEAAKVPTVLCAKDKRRTNDKEQMTDWTINKQFLLTISVFLYFLAVVAMLLLPSSVLGQQQKFRTVPHDLQVLEGAEAMMRCEVANVAGAVQWTKDGFALGFSAVIPGYPRYSVLGDRKQGVYNLRISNASTHDDAEYQCQVGPARLNSAIRANAKLTVICKYFPNKLTNAICQKYYQLKCLWYKC